MSESPSSLNLQEPTPDNNSEIKYNELAKALILFCMKDGDEAAKDLSDRLARIQSQINITRSQVNKGLVDPHTMDQNLECVMDEIMEAVVSLQFFDRISQRMDHAVRSIDSFETPQEIYSHFTMEDERILYDELVKGKTLDEAVSKANSRLHVAVDKKGSDIELF